MAKKQTRRSVSMNRALFEQAKAVADLAGVSLSQFVADAVRYQIRSAVTFTNGTTAEVPRG